MNIQTFFAKEGAQTFVDAYSVPKGSENYDLSLAWIDHMLTPEAQAEVAVVYGGAPSISKLSPSCRGAAGALQLRQSRIRSRARAGAGRRAVESDEFATDAEWEEAWNDLK